MGCHDAAIEDALYQCPLGALIMRALRWVVMLVSAGVVLAGNCQAGVMDIVSGMFSKTIEMKISVVDEQKRPVPDATLWVVYADAELSVVSVADMERVLARYKWDYDVIAQGLARPMYGLLVKYVNTKGIYSEKIQENNFRGLTELPIIIGVIKRGYRSLAYSKTMRVGSSHEIVLQMERDPEQIFDCRLLELDEIRSEASRALIDWNSDEKVAYLDQLANRLLGLAQSFEREGKREDAAVLYYNLAHLPSVDRRKSPDGKLQVVGYTRGYDEKSPTRRAYRQKALELGEAIPMLRYEKMEDAFDDQRGAIWIDQSPAKKQLRLEMISDIENLERTAAGRLPTGALHLLWMLYSYTGNPEMACKTIQRAYQTEPRAFNNWTNVFRNIEREAHKPVPGSPAFPDFVCPMPKRCPVRPTDTRRHCLEEAVFQRPSHLHG